MSKSSNRPGEGMSIPTEWAAFCAFIEAHYPVIYSVALAHVRDGEVAQEIAQDVCVRLLLERDTLPALANASGWLARVARNTAIDWVRRRQTHSRILAKMEAMNYNPGGRNSPPEDARTAAMGEEKRHRLMAALEKVTPETREMLLLHFNDRLEKQEIARLLEVHPSTIGRRMDEGLRTLRKLLSSDDATAALSRTRPANHTARTVIATLGLVASLSAADKAALAAVAAPLPTLGAGVVNTAIGTGEALSPIQVLSRLFDSAKSKAIAVALGCVVAAAISYFAIRGSVQEPANSKTRIATGAIPADYRTNSTAVSRSGSTRPNRSKPSQTGIMAVDAIQMGNLPVLTSRTELLKGIVVNEDQKPIPEASVTLWQGSSTSITVTADANGKFAVPMGAAEKNYVIASADGFAESAWGEYELMPQTPETGDPFTITLERAVTMRGRVVDETGKGLGGAKLTVVKSYDKQKQLYGSSNQNLFNAGFYNGPFNRPEFIAGPEGTFELSGLKPGFAGVRVDHSERPPILAERLPCDGENTRIVMEKGITLTGTVMDGEIPLPNITVNTDGGYNFRAGYWGGASGKTDANGRFTISGLQIHSSASMEGLYTVTAATSDTVKIPRYLISVSRGEGTYHLDMNSRDMDKVHKEDGHVNLTRYYGARTRPVDFGTASLAGTIKMPKEFSTGMCASLKKLEKPRFIDYQPIVAGRFEFNRLPAGRYTLSIEDDWKQKTAFPYTLYCPEEEIEILEGQPHSVVLSCGTSGIRVKAVDAAGGTVSNETVMIKAWNNRSTGIEKLIAASSLGKSGVFEIRGLSPGEYEVYLNLSPVQDRQIVKCLDNNVMECILVADEEPLVNVQGKVVRSNGKAVSGAQLLVELVKGGLGKERVRTLTTNSGGTFSLGLTTGTYNLTAQATQNSNLISQTIEVGKMDTSNLEIRLDGAPNSGIVVKQVGVGNELWRTAQFDLVPISAPDQMKTIYPSARTINSVTLAGISPGQYNLIIRPSSVETGMLYQDNDDAVLFATAVVPGVHVLKDNFAVVSVPIEKGNKVLLKCYADERKEDLISPRLWVKDAAGNALPIQMSKRENAMLGLVPGKYSFGATLHSGQEQSVSFQVNKSDQENKVDLYLR